MQQRIAALTLAFFADVYGLLVVDEIPGWTDMSNLAKVSVIGFLLVTILIVVVFLLRAIRSQQKEHLTAMANQQRDHLTAMAAQQAAFILEVQVSRKDYGDVIEKVRTADNERYAMTHVDMQAACRAMDRVTDRIGVLAVQCAQSQTLTRSQLSFNRREDLAQDQANRREDLAIAADHNREAAHVKANELGTSETTNV